MSTLPLKSTFAILDVKGGRAKLRQALTAQKRIHVIIHATVDGEWSGDDGISQEFGLSVTSLRVMSRRAVKVA